MPASVKKDLRISMPPQFVGGSHIELRQQLVIWKRVIFLLDNIALTPELCNRLVDRGIFNSEMMKHVQSQTFDTEKKLMMLSLLGKHGQDVYEKFLDVLESTRHEVVVKELRKTEKFIYFGEMLPPCFYYFMSLSEFLNKYPHIALKLGEDEKHILQLFIEGKISMANRVKDEHIQVLLKDKENLNKIIDELRRKLERSKDRERCLQEALDEANRRIEILKERLKKIQVENDDIRQEIRRLRHFRVQQEELYGYLGDYAQQHNVKVLDMGLFDRYKLEAEQIEQLAKEFTFFRQKTVADAKQPGLGSKQNTKLTRGVTKLERQNSRVVSMSLGIRQSSKLGSRQNTKLNIGSRQPTKMEDKAKVEVKNRDAAVMKMHLLQQQVNIMANKMFYMQYNLTEWQNEEKRIQTILTKDNLDKDYLKEMKRLLIEVHREKKVIAEQLAVLDKDVFAKEKLILEIRKEVMGSAIPTPGGNKVKHDSLVMKLHTLMNHLKLEHVREIKQIEKKHEEEITKMVQHIQELNMQHVEECNRLKGRIRQKVYQIHYREQLHKKLRRQIVVLENYQAENMNATVSVDQCRRIVRNIIGEARELKRIADEREEDVPIWEQEEHEKKKEEEEKKKKKKKKKEFKNLRNERLMYIGDRVNMRWRELGEAMGLTLNRLDMIEMDSPFAKGEDQMCFAMLKAWRDEDKGKLVDLVEGLRAINRHDLAMVVMPLNTKRVAIVKDGADTEGVTGDTTDADAGDEDGVNGVNDGDNDGVDGVDPDEVKVEVKGHKKKKGGKKEDNNKKAVPKLPKIKKK